MQTTLVIRAGWLSFCVLISAIVSNGQGVSQSVPTDPTEVSQQPPVQVVYTGRLFGYFRMPSKQSGDVFQPCLQSGDKDSQAAIDFLRNRQRYQQAVLVGTGDNFAPRREARMFDPPPKSDPQDTKYRPRNKEPYDWDWNNGVWVRTEEIQDDQLREALEKEVHDGEATIRTDNVACFFAEAGFKAIVPGKHDFYFAPERVRQLARLMASMKRPDDYLLTGDYQPVQMLGANLVIKTTRLETATASPDKKTWAWPAKFLVKNLQNGKFVYPWFSSVQVQLMEFDPDSAIPDILRKEFMSAKGPKTEDDFSKVLTRIIKTTPKSLDDQKKLLKLQEGLEEFQKKDTVYVCPAGDNSERATLDNNCKLDNQKRRVIISGNAVIDELTIDPERNGRFSTVTPGENYQLVLEQPEEKEPHSYLRFSVFRPFFYFPHKTPRERVDPDPYVFLKDKRVAIFGVVDPDIGQHIGVLNFSWLNVDEQSDVDRKFKTEVSAQDPVESLREQLRHFESKYGADNSTNPVLKILLAQMSPQRARMLAAHFPEFQIIVTAADELQGTSEVTQSTVWSPETTKSAPFMAVPSPYFYLGAPKGIEGYLHFGTVIARHEEARRWRVSAKVKEDLPLPVVSGDQWKPTKEFRDLVAGSLKKCLSANANPANFVPPFDQMNGSMIDQIKGLTLCAMREKTGADIALIQKRDLYEEFTRDDFPIAPQQQKERLQQILDRIIWKGDLLTLLYVPGGAIKKALEQSKKFEQDDSNFLSVADENWRQLEFLGIQPAGKDYLINEVPLEEKKIYAVATSDYIGAGDTGYPDLAAASLNPKTRPTQFPNKLDTISSVVCRRLFDNKQDIEKFCVGPLATADSTTAAAAPAPKPLSFSRKLLNKMPFKWPGPTPTPKTTATALEQKAQQHPIWMLSLQNFSLGFNSLSNNLTDAQISQKFSGVPVSGVTARKTHTVTMQLGTRLSRTSHENEFFVALGSDYREQSTGDVTPQIVQLNNRLTGDAGFIRSLSGGRSQSRIGTIFSLHAETPLQQPFTTFTLGTQDRLRVAQNRSLLLLPRLGVRWQTRVNSFEAGVEAGREINAFKGYRFDTTSIECLPSRTETFVKCITRLSTPPNPAITKDSVATVILQGRPRAGLYWKFNLSIPFNPKVKYELSQEADFFFNFHQDNATDTRYRDQSKHSLKFVIFPSLSVGPSLQLLFYKNKVNGDFLFQKVFAFETSLSFDLFNHREKGVQLKHKP